jgi:adenylate kinase
MMRILLLGPPGSGKGTQASALQKRWGLPHISSGDLLRAQVKNNTELGGRAKPFMETGDLVPDELIIDMMAERMSEPDAVSGYVLDGFPRTVAQAEALDARLAVLGQDLDAVISLEVPEPEILRRLLGRLTCSSPNCNAIYQVDTMPPRRPGLCDKCGSALIQRADEDPAVIRKRLAVYAEQTAPLLYYYRHTGRLHQIDGTIGVENVVKEIARLLESTREGTEKVR